MPGHLATPGHACGGLDAHDSLWAMGEKTAHDPIAHMALVPRTLEARGLDATPAMRVSLVQGGDGRAAAILDRILHDESGHVAIGSRWYRFLCERWRLDPVATFERLARDHGAPRQRGPFDVEARLAAGFTQVEGDALLRPQRAGAGGATQPPGASSHGEWQGTMARSHRWLSGRPWLCPLPSA